MHLQLTADILHGLETHAASEQPRECCGLLGGRRAPDRLIAHSRYPLRNLAARPETQFFAAPADLFNAVRRMREQGEEMLAIYHSHPCGPAHPSPTDLALAFYPEAVFVIVALAPELSIRAFRVANAAVIEVQISR